MKQRCDRVLRFLLLLLGVAGAMQAGVVTQFITYWQQDIVTAATGLGVILIIWSGFQMLTSGTRSMAHVTELVIGLFLLLGPNTIINAIRSSGLQ